MHLRRQRLVSGALFVLALAALMASGDREAAAIFAAALTLGLFVIWQAESLGSMTGLRFGSVDEASPAPLVRLLGWLLFLGACGAAVRVLTLG